MERVDAIIVGAGPAGLLVGSFLSRHGIAVAAFDPNAGAPSPQGAHVHLLPDETWAGMCRFLPDLERRVLKLGAPVAPIGAAMLDGELLEERRAWPDRNQLDRALFETVTQDERFPVLRQRAAPVLRRNGLWQLAEYRARWLIDASGGSRRTLRAAARLANVDWLEWGDRRGYASIVLNGMDWPEDRIGHGWRAAAGDGLVLRRIGGSRTLATLQLPCIEELPTTRDEFLARIAGIVPERYSCWISQGSPETSVRTWKSRRSSSVIGDAGLREAGWMAVGDALLSTAPHQGQGLTQIVNQVELVRDAFLSGQGLDAAAKSLSQWAEDRLIAATLSEQLGSPEAAAA